MGPSQYRFSRNGVILCEFQTEGFLEAVDSFIILNPNIKRSKIDYFIETIYEIINEEDWKPGYYNFGDGKYFFEVNFDGDE